MMQLPKDQVLSFKMDSRDVFSHKEGINTSKVRAEKEPFHNKIHFHSECEVTSSQGTLNFFRFKNVINIT